MKPDIRFKEDDFKNIGVLTDEQVNLQRKFIKQIIVNRKLEVQIEEARAEGKPINKCSSCGRLYAEGKGHFCFNTGWGVDSRVGGLPQRRDVLVSQVGKTKVTIGRTHHIDECKLAREHEQMNALARLPIPTAGAFCGRARFTRRTRPRSSFMSILSIAS